MEDQKRGMAPPKKIAQPPREGGGKEKRFNVMVMRGLGGVWSFNLSPVLVLWAVLFFTAFTVTSLLAINGFLHLRRLTALQTREINQLTEKADHRLKDLRKAEQRMALLKSYIRDLENPQKEKRETVPEKKSVPQKEGQTPVAQKPAVQPVGVRGLAVRKEGSRMTVDFRLANLDPAEKAVGGYVHTLIHVEGSDPPRRIIFPKQKLKTGLPVNYRRGQPFLIQRFRTIKAAFDLTAIPQPPSSIRVLVYDQSGTLMLNRVFEVSDDS